MSRRIHSLASGLFMRAPQICWYKQLCCQHCNINASTILWLKFLIYLALAHLSVYQLGLEQIKAPWLEGVECSPRAVMSDPEPHFRNIYHLSSSSTEFKSTDSKSSCRGFVCFTRLVTKITNSPATLVQHCHRGQVSQK
jgi:hypothetical protein